MSNENRSAEIGTGTARAGSGCERRKTDMQNSSKLLHYSLLI
jgi:hypothetical protein